MRNIPVTAFTFLFLQHFSKFCIVAKQLLSKRTVGRTAETKTYGTTIITVH